MRLARNIFNCVNGHLRYDGKDEACQYNRSKVAVRVSGGLEISQNETQMAQVLFLDRPLNNLSSFSGCSKMAQFLLA